MTPLFISITLNIQKGSIALISFFRRTRYASGVTRAIQIAERVGGKVDPKEGYENDACVYLLGRTPDGDEPEYSYYDVMDCGYARLSRVKAGTKGAIITISKSQWNELRALPRTIYFIPHHHVNYDRELRPKDRPVLKIGCCGGDSAIQWPHDRMKVWVGQYGLEWYYTNEYLLRDRVVDYYRQLDIQIVFRPTHTRGIPGHTNPIKLSNAGSFGIPTVAYPEIAYAGEWEPGEVIYADNMGELMKQVERLKNDKEYYAEASERARIKAEEYHIDKIIPMYEALPGAK